MSTKNSKEIPWGSVGNAQEIMVNPGGIAAALNSIQAGALTRAAQEVSERLARIELHMGTIPWKSEARVVEPGGGTLSYERVNGDWGLCWSEIDLLQGVAILLGAAAGAYKNGKSMPKLENKILLRDCSIEVKARAAQLLPDLVMKVQEQSINRIQTVNATNEALAALEARLFGKSVKGEM